MRSLGEHHYREWHIERVQETSATLYLFCLFAQTSLVAGVGAAVVYFTNWQRDPVLLAIGLGIVAYALAVAFYTLLGVWRLRRATLREARLAQQKATSGEMEAIPVKSGSGMELYGRAESQVQGK
jgi:hypothetical protein